MESKFAATNDELGALADISPFTASRLVSNWARAGTVSKGAAALLSTTRKR